MNTTSIQWTDMSVNPIRAQWDDGKDDGARTQGHYCEKVSPGCANCYASRLQPRFKMPTFEQAKARGHVTPFFDASRLDAVLKRRKPTRIFWCDMTDLFGQWVPDEWIDRCFAVMALTPQHTHQILTKRPERMRDYLTERARSAKPWKVPFPLPNVWLGVSCEDQPRFNERVGHLAHTPAAVRFLSLEPLLGPISWNGYTVDIPWGGGEARGGRNYSPLMDFIDWVIVGGESGPGARDCDADWIRAIVESCEASGVACFVKQLGSAAFDSDRTSSGRSETIRTSDRKGGDPCEWPEDLRIRQFPQVRA